MKHSDSIVKLAEALTRVQAKLSPVHKDAENSHFRNRYATLDAIAEAARPLLAEEGLAVIQGGGEPIVADEGVTAITLETRLLHKSGEWLESSMTLPLAKIDPQGVGSAVTYGRRYGLCAMLGVTTDEDDDGNAASTPRPAAKPRERTPEAERPAPKGDAAPASSEPSCPKCGGRTWDNRKDKKNPRAPDFKCRTKTCEGAIWPPKKADEDDRF